MLKLLTSRAAGPVGLGLSLLLGLALLWLLLVKNSTIAGLNLSLKEAKEDNQVLRSDNQTLRGNNLGLEAGLSACNAGVANVKAQTDAITKAGIIAVDAVKAASAKSARDAAAVLAMPRATCADALAILKAGAN